MSQTRTFSASILEVERAEHWKKHHGPCRQDASSRQIEWRFADAGSVGQLVIIACLSCGAHLDVSDYDSW